MNKQYLPNRMLALVKFALLAGAIFCCFINAAAQTPSGETVAKANTEIAAKSSKAAAEYKLATKYRFGRGGFDVNNDEAIYWARKSADDGYAKAYTLLGYMHYFGYGVETDEQKARDFFVTGAKLGDKYAVMHLYILENKETQKNNKEKPQNLQQYLPKISSLPGNQSSDKEFD